MNLNVNDDSINLNVSGNNTKIESGNNNIELNISNNNMNVEGEPKKLNLGVLPPKVTKTDNNHNNLINRDLPNQHPIKSIEGLVEDGDGTKFLSDDGTYKEVKIFDDVVEDILVNGESVVDENGLANILVPRKTSDLLNDSNFITNLAKDLVNYYLKSEVYTKEEINQLASTLQNVSISIVNSLPSTGQTNVIYFVSKTGKENDIYDEWIYINSKWEHIGSTQIDLTGYATEDWVKDQEYMPIPDFLEYIQYYYYDTEEIDTLFDDFYTKEEIDSALENLPTGGAELTGGDNTVIEDKAINVYTNTGYKVSDKDIQLQSIIDSGTTGTNKIVYGEDKEIMFIIDGTNKLRKSENGIDFEVIELPRNCKDILYMSNHNRLICLSDDGYFFYSDDLGLTWTEKQSSWATGGDYLFRQAEYTKGFGIVNITNKTLTTLSETFSLNSNIKSIITPNFWAKVNNTQFIWCNSTGTFKYGAGSQEGNFASLSGITINLLKRVNNITMLGLKNSNKIYLLESANSITAYKWIEHTLLDTCTVNDIIFNPYDETYYIFTDINTYYKTKDFVNYESVDKGVKGIQGYFTSMGIQMTTPNHNELLLAPTRTKLENKAQEWDRALNKSLWVGKGLEEDEEGKVNAVGGGAYIGVNANGIYLKEVDKWALTQDILEGVYVAKGEEKDLFDPYEIENWYYSEEAYPTEDYKAVKFLFNQAGSFYDQVTWETEYVVEQYEYGYLFYDYNMSIFKYVKLGNKSWMFNKGE